MVILDAVQSVLSVVIMISIGYVMTDKKWMDENTSKLFSKIVMNIALPALMISNLMTTFDREKLLSSGVALISPLVSIAISYTAGIGVARALNINKSRHGVFKAMFAFSNTIFMGLPLCVSLFGDESTPFVFLYYFANTILFWTIGTYGIRKDMQDKRAPFFSKETLGKVLPPPLSFFIIVVVLILLKVHLPKFIMDSSKYIGNLTTPLSMLFIGNVLHNVGLRRLKIDKDAVALMVGRFIIAPMLVFVLLRFFPVPEIAGKVFVIQSAMPIMTQTAIISEVYGADHRYATSMVTITTVASLIFIPVYNLLFTLM